MLPIHLSRYYPCAVVTDLRGAPGFLSTTGLLIYVMRLAAFERLPHLERSSRALSHFLALTCPHVYTWILLCYCGVSLHVPTSYFSAWAH